MKVKNVLIQSWLSGELLPRDLADRLYRSGEIASEVKEACDNTFALPFAPTGHRLDIQISAFQSLAEHYYKDPKPAIFCPKNEAELSSFQDGDLVFTTDSNAAVVYEDQGKLALKWMAISKNVPESRLATEQTTDKLDLGSIDRVERHSLMTLLSAARDINHINHYPFFYVLHRMLGEESKPGPVSHREAQTLIDAMYGSYHAAMHTPSRFICCGVAASLVAFHHRSLTNKVLGQLIDGIEEVRKEPIMRTGAGEFLKDVNYRLQVAIFRRKQAELAASKG